MKWTRLVAAALLPALAAGRVVPTSANTGALINSTSAHSPSDASAGSLPVPVFVAGGDSRYIPRSEAWQKYVCRGQKLWQAMVRDRDKAAEFLTPIDSPFDGTLEEELKHWGYIERNDDAADQCMFDQYLRQPLEALKIDPKGSARGGPNQCFYFQHYDPNKKDEEGYLEPVYKQRYEADGKTYRATQAKAIIGVNAQSGVVYFLDVISAVEGAKQAWGLQTNPPADQLPALKQISNMAWGAWCRVHEGNEHLDNINLFLVNDIRNKVTKQLVAEALKTYNVPEGQKRKTSLPIWPGLVFGSDTEEGAAMLGSPNGIAVGYFLAQHKKQLGGNKYVYKIQLWVEWEGYDPSILFYVTNAPKLPL